MEGPFECALDIRVVPIPAEEEATMSTSSPISPIDLLSTSPSIELTATLTENVGAVPSATPTPLPTSTSASSSVGPCEGETPGSLLDSTSSDSTYAPLLQPGLPGPSVGIEVISPGADEPTAFVEHSSFVPGAPTSHANLSASSSQSPSSLGGGEGLTPSPEQSSAIFSNGAGPSPSSNPMVNSQDETPTASSASSALLHSSSVTLQASTFLADSSPSTVSRSGEGETLAPSLGLSSVTPDTIDPVLLQEEESTPLPAPLSSISSPAVFPAGSASSSNSVPGIPVSDQLESRETSPVVDVDEQHGLAASLTLSLNSSYEVSGTLLPDSLFEFDLGEGGTVDLSPTVGNLSSTSGSGCENALQDDDIEMNDTLSDLEGPSESENSSRVASPAPPPNADMDVDDSTDKGDDDTDEDSGIAIYPRFFFVCIV